MTERILYATMAWFEATPSGRLINRFSQDISTIDTGVMSRLQVRADKRTRGEEEVIEEMKRAMD